MDWSEGLFYSGVSDVEEKGVRGVDVERDVDSKSEKNRNRKCG